MLEDFIGKTIGSYTITQKIDSGATATVFECWLNPYADLEEQLLSGERKSLRPIAGVKHDGDLTEEDRQNIRNYTGKLKEEFAENLTKARSDDECLKLYGEDCKLIELIAPDRRLDPNIKRAAKSGNMKLAVKRALKILDNDKVRQRAKQDPNFLERFQQEIDICRKLRHGNIGQTMESGRIGDIVYAVMEFIEGVPLDERKPSIIKATYEIKEALEGLIHAHEKGILHRDIKPENLLVTKDNDVKIIDFGIAQKTDPSDSQSAKKLTEGNIVMGTPYYMSPERARGETFIPKSDLYSLGATFYHFLTGSPPPTATTSDSVIYELAEDRDWKWVRELNPDVSEELEDVVMRMIGKVSRFRSTTYETLVELNDIMERQLERYKEPSKQDEKGKKQAIKKIRKDIARAGRNATELEIGRLYESLASNYSRDVKGVKKRKKTLKQALKYCQSYLEKQTERSKKAEANERIESIEGKLDFEERRIKAKGLQMESNVAKYSVIGTMATAAAVLIGTFLYDSHQEKEAAKKAKTAFNDDIAAVATAISKKDYAMARKELGEAGEYTKDRPQSDPDARKVHELDSRIENFEILDKVSLGYFAARDQAEKKDFAAARSSLEEVLVTEAKLSEEYRPMLEDIRFDAANSLYAVVQQLLGDRNYAEANSGLDLISWFIDKIAVTDKQKKRAEELASKIKDAKSQIVTRMGHIKRFQGMTEMLGQVTAEYAKLDEQLKAEKFFNRAEFSTLEDTLDQASAGLSGVEAAAVGTDDYQNKSQAIKDTKEKIVGLRQAYDKGLLAYFTRNSKQLDDVLNSLADYTQDGTNDRLKTALETLKAADVHRDKAVTEELKFVQEQLSAYASRLQEVQARVSEYSTWLKQSADGSDEEKRAANTSLVKTYLGFARVADAEKHLAFIPDKTGLEAYVTIIDLEKQATSQNPPAKELLQQLSDAYRAAGYDKRADAVLQKIKD